MRRRLLGGTPPVAGGRAHTTAATHAAGSPTTRADASATTWHSAASTRSRAQPQRRRYHRAPTSTGTRSPTTSPRGSARCRSRPRTQPHRPGRSRTTPTMRGRNPATTTATATAATTAEPRATDATHRPRPCATSGTTKNTELGGTAALCTLPAPGSEKHPATHSNCARCQQQAPRAHRGRQRHRAEGQRRPGTQQHLASRERSLLLFLLLLLLRRVGGGLIVVHRLGRHRDHRRPRCRRRSLSFHCLCCHLSSLKYCSAWSGLPSSAGTESRAIHTAQSPASAPVKCSTHHQAESRPVHATSAAATV